MPLLRAWLTAFTITVLSELLVALPLLAPGGSRARRIAAVCLAQLATHPSVWFIWPLLGLPRPLFLLVAEAFACLTEALIYRLCFERLSWSRCLAASALANGASVLLGIFAALNRPHAASSEPEWWLDCWRECAITVTHAGL